MKDRVRNILVVTSWAYNDGLIQSSTLPYLRMIHSVAPGSVIYLVTEEKDSSLQNKEARENIRKELAASNIILLPRNYRKFGPKKLFFSLLHFLQLWRIICAKNISHIHCFCTPAGAIGYFLSLFSGKKLVLDSYEPHAESMVENGTWDKGGVAFKLLWWLEKKQSLRASYCIAAASGMDDYARKKYGVQIKLAGIRPCCVNLDQFQYDALAAKKIRSELQWHNKIVCAYAGKFGGIYLENEAFDFFRAAYKFWGEQFRVLLLSPSSGKEIKQLCINSRLPENVVYRKKVPFRDMAAYLSTADFAITPVKPVPSKRYCTPIKDGEYWAIGLPVVITRDISDDSQIIERNDAGAILFSLEKNAYDLAVKKIDDLLRTDRDQLRERIRRLAEQYRHYRIAREVYERVYSVHPQSKGAESNGSQTVPSQFF